MFCNRSSIILVAVLITGIISTTLAVPPRISYQGRLATPDGIAVADGDYTVQFRIYAESAGGAPLWTETNTVAAKDGLFSVILGTINDIESAVFDGSVRFLGIQVGASAELTPRTPIVSVAYAMAAGSVDVSSSDCHECDTIFVNVVGPETIRSTADTTLRVLNEHSEAKVALSASVTSTTTDTVSAIKARAFKNQSGAVFAGDFVSENSGLGTTSAIRLRAENNSDIFASNGVFAQAKNLGRGVARGGYFSTESGGSGIHLGINAIGNSDNDRSCYGVLGVAAQVGSGDAVGGSFQVYGGSGKRIGVNATAEAGGDSASYGIKTWARNSWIGKTYGGWFEADSSAYSSLVGCTGYAKGGNQWAKGLEGIATVNSIAHVPYGCSGSGSNLAGGIAYGGIFSANTVGGTSISLYGESNGYLGVQDESFAVYGRAGGNVTSAAYGGYFATSCLGGTQYGAYLLAQNGQNEVQYGTYSLSENLIGASTSYGVYGRSEHSGSGNSIGGYFLVDSTGTGTAYGGRTVGLSKGSAAAYGIASYAANRGNGAVYGGFFEIGNYGTGTRYAVYGKSPISGYAGYFDGDVRVTDDFTVVGTKSAAVMTGNDEYRLVYCQESPENWFEDFGEGTLVNGKAHIDLDPTYLSTVTINTENPMKVFIQLNDPNCNGTAVIRGTTGFDVVELQNGRSSASFSFRVVAKRKGFETLRLERMPGLTPEQVSADASSKDAELQAEADRQLVERQKQNLSALRLKDARAKQKQADQ